LNIKGFIVSAERAEANNQRTPLLYAIHPLSSCILLFALCGLPFACRMFIYRFLPFSVSITLLGGTYRGSRFLT